MIYEKKSFSVVPAPSAHFLNFKQDFLSYHFYVIWFFITGLKDSTAPPPSSLFLKCSCNLNFVLFLGLPGSLRHSKGSQLPTAGELDSGKIH